MPKISVAMGVYNGSKYIREAIKSILNQTYTDFEFIICDDCSTDNTIEIIQEFIKQDNRIILVGNETNSGLAFSLNNCIAKSKGEYIARMDDDDVSLPDRFKIQVEFLENNPNYAFVGGCAKLFDNDGIWGLWEEKVTPDKTDVFKKPCYIHPTVMMRKKDLQAIGGYTVSKHTRRGQDYDLWCKFYAENYIGMNLREILLNYRRDKISYSKSKFKYRWNSYMIKKIWRKKLKLPLIYEAFTFKPLVVSLIPHSIMFMYHKNKYKD